MTELETPASTMEENPPERGSMPRWLRLVLGLLALVLTAAIFLAYNQTGLVFDLFSLRYCG